MPILIFITVLKFADEKSHMEDCTLVRSLLGDQPPRGAGATAHERQIDHQTVREDPGSRLGTRGPVETTAGMVGSGNSRPVTNPKPILDQCPTGKRTLARRCVPNVGPWNGEGGQDPDEGRLPILGLG